MEHDEFPSDRRKRTRVRRDLIRGGLRERRGYPSPLSMRLTDQEVAMLEELQARMGGATRTQVIEEALIKYLPIIAKEGAFVDKGLAPAPKAARQYKIRRDVGEALGELCGRRGWHKNRIVRHAVKELFNRG